MSKATFEQANSASTTMTDREVILQLVDALQILIDTPKSGPRSVGDWKSAEKIATSAINLARSRDESIP